MSLPSERPSTRRTSHGPAASYSLRSGRREFPIEVGETVIGRGDGCHLLVNENLVSRRHARLLNGPDGLFIEDLGSANGTFVNQTRLDGRTRLASGDHVFIGTLEIEIVGNEPADSDPTIEDRPTPSSGIGIADRSWSSGAPSSGRRVARTEEDEPPDPTLHAESLEYLGRLADKMFTLGRIDAARRILAPEIERILEVARHGHLPAIGVLDTAGVYAMKLANETLEARWANAAVELHLIACRPMRDEAIQRFAALRMKAPLGDEDLLARYYERLRANLAGMSSEERVFTERIACLLPTLD